VWTDKWSRASRGVQRRPAMVRDFLLSHTSWRSNLARRINPLPAPLRLFLLVLLASFLGSIPVHASNVSLPASWHRSSFAIGDFDGDSRPDLATIQPVLAGPSAGIYTVRLEFSAGGPLSFDMVGPLGGVRIAARDVNGDAVPDLVLSSASREEPVAILLNNGRGAFSLLDPSSFPGAFNRSKNYLSSDLPSQKDPASKPPQSPGGELSESKYLLHPRPAAATIPEASSVAFLSVLLVSLPERAPPIPSRA
jgi:hypothetical protein